MWLYPRRSIVPQHWEETELEAWIWAARVFVDLLLLLLLGSMVALPFALWMTCASLHMWVAPPEEAKEVSIRAVGRNHNTCASAVYKSPMGMPVFPLLMVMMMTTA